MPDEERASSPSDHATPPDPSAATAASTSRPTRERVRAAIDEASDEVGLEIWYRSCVEPLLPLADADLPSCCGANCEPCNMTLIEVAVRTRRILAADATAEPRAPGSPSP